MEKPTNFAFTRPQETLFDEILGTMTPRGKKPRKEWEAYHLLDFATSIRDSNWGREKKRYLERILDEQNIGFSHLQQRTCDGYQEWKSQAIFKALSEAQNMPKLVCFLKFLEFCRDHEPDPLPLSVFNGRESSPKNIDEFISDIKTHIEAQKQETKNPTQPHLTVPESKEGNPNYYANAVLHVIGRDKEKKRLEDFLNCDKNVAWLQLAGVAGQGKSRLAFDLVNHAINDLGWNAGFLEENGIRRFKDKWFTWQPDKPHLIVFDYVIGREHDIKPILQDLSERQGDLSHNIRILLVERQRWDNRIDSDNRDVGSDVLGFRERKSEWYLNLCQDKSGNDTALRNSRFEKGVEELTNLDGDDLAKIVERVAELEAGKPLSLSASVIQKTLERIDKDGRPLYAYFLGQMIGQGADIKDWSKVDLLREVLGREREKWWAAAFKDRNKPPRTEDDFPASRLAILATMIDGLDCEDAQKKEFIPVPTADDREQALALTGNPMSEDMDGSPPMVIPSMQPDLLGEWYVIVSLEKPWSPLKELTDIAWRYAPEKMGHFMQKLFQDFHDSPTTAAILECIDPDRIEINTLSKLINDLLTFLVAHRLEIPEKITQTLHILADSGDPQSLSSLGLCFDCGIGVKINIHEAIDCYQKAADAGNAIALNMLGLCHQFGNGVDESISKAADYFKRAAEAGSPDAMNNYAACLQLGKGVEENIPEAVYWYRKAVEADITNAMINYGFCYDKGTGVKEDKQEAAFWYKKAADNGSSYAMYRLGLCYQYGIGVEENISKAMYWQQEAAELGNVCAMCELGGFNEDGVGKEQDYSKAIYCYKEAVKAVESNMASFGMYRQAGTKSEKSTLELVDWQHKGEKHCYAVALYKLGHFYENGLGVEKDISRAVNYYKKAAKHGHKSAMFSLGAFYLDGEVVEKDATKAVELYERAANLGHVAAMNNIGYFYENEIGVARDFLRAFEYYQKAADFGNETAKIYIDSYRFAVKLLNGNNDDDTIVSTLKGLSFQHCLFDDWPDTPLSIGNWFIPLNDWAFWLLLYLYHGIKYHGQELDWVFDELATVTCQRIRWVHLDFYPGNMLVDIGFYCPEKQQTRYCSVITDLRAVGPMYGKSVQLHAMNSKHLWLESQDTQEEYLRFYCECVYGEHGPLHIVSDLDEIQSIVKPGENLPQIVAQSFFPLRHIEGEFSKEGWRRFEACTLFKDALYISKFRLFPNGNFVREKDSPIAENLPILRRTYDGIFRSPLQ